jgi:hypothetical protein
MVKTLLGNIDPGTRKFLHTQSRLGGVHLILSATSDLGGLFHLDEDACELLWRRKDASLELDLCHHVTKNRTRLSTLLHFHK